MSAFVLNLLLYHLSLSILNPYWTLIKEYRKNWQSEFIYYENFDPGNFENNSFNDNKDNWPWLQFVKW